MASPRLAEIARQCTDGTWEDVQEAAHAHRLTPEQTDRVCEMIALGVPRPGDGSDQPSLTAALVNDFPCWATRTSPPRSTDTRHSRPEDRT